MKFYFLIAALLFISCNHSKSNETALAQVGDEQLFPSDIAAMMPKEITKEDSVYFYNAYIRQWISDQVMKLEAEKLPEPADLSIKLDRYKSQLLTQELREKIISERLSESIKNENDSTNQNLGEAAKKENKKWLIWQQYQEELIKKYEAEGTIKKP